MFPRMRTLLICLLIVHLFLDFISKNDSIMRFVDSLYSFHRSNREIKA